MAGTPAALPPDNNLSIPQGATRTLLLAVTLAGQPVDLTGARVVLGVKNQPGDLSTLFQKDSRVGGQVTIGTPTTAGKATIFILAADTAALAPGGYVYDVWVVLASGARYEVVPTSNLVITPSVAML